MGLLRLNFRKDINGLRAIAVLAVLLYHFNGNWLPGGFAGVDVFFVISGYLMTGIIFNGLKNDNFSFLTFYTARANRILPPLIMLCVVLLLLGWFYLSPIEYRSLGKHVASSLSFLSNVVYLTEAGYFDAQASEKWLLHTWSLSAEWQFYIIYPLVLVLLSRFFSVRVIKKLVVLFTLLSFGYGVYLTMNKPDSAYYLLSTRAWEMTLGGLAYLFPITLKNGTQKWVEYLGILLIVTSYFLIANENAWPGYLAAIPALGTYLVINANRGQSVFTNNFVFQKIGTYSYSIYLWHWPIVVLFRKLNIDNWFALLLGIMASIFIGFISWKCIEQKKYFRVTHWLQIFSFKYLYVAAITALLSVAVYGLNGLNQRFDGLSGGNKSPKRFCTVQVDGYQSPDEACEYFKQPVSWAVLGDSHSIELAYSLATKLQPQNVGLKQFSYQGCFPEYRLNEHPQCNRWYEDVVEYLINDEQIKHVVIGQRLSSILGLYLGNTYDRLTLDAEESFRLLDEIVFKLANTKETVYVIEPIPELREKVGTSMTQNLLRGSGVLTIKGIEKSQYVVQNYPIFEHIRKTSYPANVRWISVKDVFCDELNCYAVRDGKVLYFDADHPSTTATDMISSIILE